jgi:hypothetical protein
MDFRLPLILKLLYSKQATKIYSFEWLSLFPSTVLHFFCLVLSEDDDDLKRIHKTKSGASSGGSSSQPITYHGGPVMNNPAVYIIWYGNWAGNSAIQIITNFVQNLGNTAWWNIDRAYNNTSPIIYRGSAYDSYSQGTQLTDSSIFWIVDGAIYYGVLPYDTNGIYLVLTSSDCTQTEFCTQACGWHKFNSQYNLKYAWIGNPETQCPQSCSAQSVSPNGNSGADAMVSIIAHELAEAVSDPNLNAWYDASGNEDADKCAWTFGSEYLLSNGAYYNIVVNGLAYLIQQLWKIPSQTCGMS